MRVTYLDLFALRVHLGLLGVVAERRVLVVDLVAQLVDEALELVLLVFGIGHELILHHHFLLLFGGGFLGRLVHGGRASGERQFALAHLLLNLSCLWLLVRVHGLRR